MAANDYWIAHQIDDHADMNFGKWEVVNCRQYGRPGAATADDAGCPARHADVFVTRAEARAVAEARNGAALTEIFAAARDTGTPPDWGDAEDPAAIDAELEGLQ